MCFTKDNSKPVTTYAINYELNSMIKTCGIYNSSVDPFLIS